MIWKVKWMNKTFRIKDKCGKEHRLNIKISQRWIEVYIGGYNVLSIKISETSLYKVGYGLRLYTYGLPKNQGVGTKILEYALLILKKDKFDAVCGNFKPEDGYEELAKHLYQKFFQFDDQNLFFKMFNNKDGLKQHLRELAKTY